MRSTATRGLLASFLLLCLAFLAAPAHAQAPTAAAVESWIDGLLTEMRSSGATRAERGAVTADGSGGFSVAGITVGLPNAVTVQVTRLSGAGVAAGARFSAQRLRIEGFTVAADVVRVEAPGMDLEGLDLPSLTAADLFGRGNAGLVATLRELNLTRWSMPSLTLRGGQGPSNLQAALRDVVIENVQRGVAQRMSYGPTEFSARDETNTVSGNFGTITAEAIDFAVNAAVISPPPGAARELMQAYARATFAGGQIDLGQGVRLALGRMDVTNARIRPPRTGYLEFLRFTLDMQGRNPNQGDPEQMRRLATMMQDYFDLSEVERITIAQSTVTSPQGTFTLGGFEGRDLGSARFGRLAITDLEFEAPEASMSVGSFALSEVDYTDALRIFLDAMAAGQAVPNPALFEGRLPRIGGIELRDVSVEAQDHEMTLDSATFAMGRWRGFVPDLLRLTVGELSVPSALIEASGTMQRPTPSDLGYESLDFGGEVQIRIDEQARTARLSPGRVAIDELGSVSVELTLGDVDSGQFGFAGLSNPLPLLQQTTFRELRLRIENSGLIDRYANWSEGNQRAPAAQVRAQITQGLAPLVEVFIQDPAQKERARAAVQAFGREQRSLTLVITPRSRLTLLEIMAATQGGGPPLQLLGQVNLELSAND